MNIFLVQMYVGSYIKSKRDKKHSGNGNGGRIRDKRGCTGVIIKLGINYLVMV